MKYPEITEPVEGWIIASVAAWEQDVKIHRAIIHKGPMPRGRGNVVYQVETGPLVWSLLKNDISSDPQEHKIGFINFSQVAFSSDELLEMLKKTLSSKIHDNENAIYRLTRGISDYKKLISDYEMELIKAKNKISLIKDLKLPDVRNL